MYVSRSRASLPILESPPAGSRRRIFVFQQKQKRRIAGGNLVSMLQPLLLDSGAVHQRSITAVEVPHAELSLLPAQQAMLSRNRRIDDRDPVRRLSPDADVTFG